MARDCRAGQVRNSGGPLNQWPRGHLIFMLSAGPPAGLGLYRCSTSAGSRTALGHFAANSGPGG
jgi:hypothetical protein